MQFLIDLSHYDVLYFVAFLSYYLTGSEPAHTYFQKDYIYTKSIHLGRTHSMLSKSRTTACWKLPPNLVVNVTQIRFSWCRLPNICQLITIHFKLLLSKFSSIYFKLKHIYAVDLLVNIFFSFFVPVQRHSKLTCKNFSYLFLFRICYCCSLLHFKQETVRSNDFKITTVHFNYVYFINFNNNRNNKRQQ